MTARVTLLFAAGALAAGVVLGAFGAHALAARLPPELGAVYRTAVQYHFWHALGLFGVGLLWLHWPQAAGLAVVSWLLLAGLVFFCGSLYALALTGARSWGLVTPLGGVALVAAWLVLFWVVLRH